MRILGLPIPFTGERAKALEPVYGGERGGWVPIIREPYAGAWQRNVQIDNTAVQSFHADYACKTLIASDIAKLRVKYVEQDKDKIWFETENSAYSPVLRRPNNYQSRIQFWENYILSKLSCGNTYVLKQRDIRGVVNALYVLDPHRVRPLVSDDGDVFYQLDSDNLAGVEDTTITVPAREIIHDRMNCIFHPLVGVPPIFASGRASQQGLNIQNNSIKLFKNASTPGGMLLAPGKLNEKQITQAKEDWEINFGGSNIGRIAVLGDGLKFEKVALTAVEGQLIEQLKWTAEVVCSTYHVPPYKIGVGALPSFNNVQSLNTEYYSQALQVLIEAAELCLDEGLEIRTGAGTEFDLEGLLRMDSVTQITVLREAIAASVMSPNEARARIDLPPVEGGESPMAQQQNYSLAALAKRDAQPDPFGTAAPAPAAASSDDDDGDEKSLSTIEIKHIAQLAAKSYFDESAGVIPFDLLKYDLIQRHTPGGHEHDQQTHAGDDGDATTADYSKLKNMPKEIEGVEIEKRALGSGVLAIGGSAGILVNTSKRAAVAWKDMAAYQKRAFEAGWSSSPHPNHVIWHELAHVKVKNSVDIGHDSYLRNLHGNSNPHFEKMAAQVSTYAKTNGHEFISEVFAARRAGRSLSKEVIDYYEYIKGPKP